jgi:hypothetical protein
MAIFVGLLVSLVTGYVLARVQDWIVRLVSAVEGIRSAADTSADALSDIADRYVGEDDGGEEDEVEDPAAVEDAWVLVEKVTTTTPPKVWN